MNKQKTIKRWYYSDSVADFLKSTTEEIIGRLAVHSDFPIERTQRSAWLEEIHILRKVLYSFSRLLSLQKPAENNYH